MRTQHKYTQVITINLIVLVFFILDRVLKNLVLSGCENSWFNLHYNQGMAFGLDFINPNWLLGIIVVILLALIFGLIKLYKARGLKHKEWYILGFSFIVLRSQEKNRT